MSLINGKPPLTVLRTLNRAVLLHPAGTLREPGDRPTEAVMDPQTDLVTPEILRKIRAENQLLLRATQDMQASIDTGRWDEAVPIAAELGEVLRQHVLLVDGVLDVLTPDSTVTRSKGR